MQFHHLAILHQKEKQKDWQPVPTVDDNGHIGS
jgi:hypothetical protein